MKNITKEEDKPAIVAEMSNQAGETHVHEIRKWAKPSIWTERMLTALEEGVKVGKRLRPNAKFGGLGLFTLTATNDLACQSRCGNHQLESRMREIRLYGSEVGEAQAFPTLYD
ncbi:MAG: hypothetical protein HQK89_10725 [Nitrospirae bacterium]|nr:hypothetical protein [Nitrospirota bacterium]